MKSYAIITKEIDTCYNEELFNAITKAGMNPNAWDCHPFEHASVFHLNLHHSARILTFGEGILSHCCTVLSATKALEMLAAGEIEGQLMPWEVALAGFRLVTDEERADNDYPYATAAMYYWEPVGAHTDRRGWYDSGSDSTGWRKHVSIKAWAVPEDYEFPASIPTKICTTCNDPKPFEDFHRNTANKDGYCGECKACKSKYNKRRYAEKTGKNKSTGERDIKIAAMMKDLDRLQEEVRLLKGK